MGRSMTRSHATWWYIDRIEEKKKKKRRGILRVFRMPALVDISCHALAQLISGDHDGASWSNFQTTRSPALEQAGHAFFSKDVHEKFWKRELFGYHGFGDLGGSRGII